MAGILSGVTDFLFGKPPDVPSASDMISGQNTANTDAIRLNNYDVTTQGGNSQWTYDENGDRMLTVTPDPQDYTLNQSQQTLHGGLGDLAGALLASQGGNISAGVDPVGPPPTPKPGQGVINTDPTDAYSVFRQTGVLPGGSGLTSYGPPPVTQAGTDAPGDTGGGSGTPSSTSTGQTVVDEQGNPVYGTTYGNSNNSAYLEAMGVKPAVAAQDLYAWQSQHPDGTPMPRGWTLEGSISSSLNGGGVGGGGAGGYNGALGQTVGAAPTLGTVGNAAQNQTIAGVGQNQGVTQAQALAQMQMQAPIAAYNGTTPVAGYASGGDIAGYNAAAPKFGTTATPANLAQFNGQAPTAQMIANGGSVAGAGEGIQKTLDLSNLGNMPTASEATLKQVQDALYARDTGYLDPQFQASQAALDAKLANQGLGIGSRAYDIARAQEASAKEKAYSGARNDAIIMGGAEQSRLFNLQMAARQQGYTEDLGAGNFQNQAQNQGYTQQLANQQNVIQGTSANNAAQNAQLAANMAIMQQNNAAKQTDFTNQFNITGQNNAAQQALGQYNLGAGTLNANIGNMNAQNALGAGQLNANIGIANNQAALGAGTLNANIANNNFQNTLATNQFNNAAITGNLNNQINAQGFNNTANNQNLANQVTTQGFNNTAANQDYQNMLAGVGFNNTAATQGYQNTLSGTGFNNAVQQQGIANQFSQQGLNINAAQAQAQMAAAKASAASAAGQVAASIAARNQAYTLAQQQRTDALNQQQFNNFMTTQQFNNGVTNTGNNINLDTYKTGLTTAGVNQGLINSDVGNLATLDSHSGAVLQPPGGGGAGYTTSPPNVGALDQSAYLAELQKYNSGVSGINAGLNVAGKVVGSPLAGDLWNSIYPGFGV